MLLIPSSDLQWQLLQRVPGIHVLAIVFSSYLLMHHPMLRGDIMEKTKGLTICQGKVFDRLMDEGYVIFHKEPNIQYNPSCIEYGFLKIQPSKGVRFIKKGAYRGIMCV